MRRRESGPGRLVQDLSLRAGLAAAAFLAAGCVPSRGVADGLRTLAAPRTASVTTDGGNASLIHALRTDAGVVVVDLGWNDAERALRGALARLDATPRDVVAVLLTHSHRDHVGAWRAVAHAPFHVGRGEGGRLRGAAAHRGWIPRLADRVRRPALPDARVTVRELPGDTALVFGRDTVRAFALPGHTPGSVAWLVDGVLLVGDGASHSPTSGRLRPARRGFSDDAEQAARSLARLRDAVAPYRVRAICTAHARCAPADPATWERLAPR